MLSIEPKDLDLRDIYYYLIGGIGPRPIAFVSTISKEGKHNLAPFSFFNAFSSNPPIIGFAPARRGRDGTNKDTYYNLMDTKECVVQVVTYDIVEQMNLTAGDFPAEVDEFEKSGLTPLDSDFIKSKRVKESPFQMECKLHDMISFGDQPGSGNLALCEVIKFHIDERVLKDGKIDPQLIDLVGRHGGAYYSRSYGDAIFEVGRPNTNCIGYEQLPDFIKQSKTYSANDIAKFANSSSLPEDKDIELLLENSKEDLNELIKLKDSNAPELISKIENAAKSALTTHDLEFAFKIAFLVKHWELLIPQK